MKVLVLAVVRPAMIVAVVWLAGCGTDGGTDPGADGGTGAGVSIRLDDVQLCRGATITAVDVVGVNRIDIGSSSCATPFQSTFFEMFDTDVLPCTLLRVDGQGCDTFGVQGSVTRAGTTADGGCTCNYEDVVPGGTNVPHVIELSFDDVELQPQ